jgi:outer membrane protein OmpA-like peptidoglycan-associated protein
MPCKVLFFSFLFLTSCSTTPEVQQFSDSAIPSQEISNLEANINKARGDQVNILSPTNFKKANEYLKEAKKESAKNSSDKKILKDVAIGNAWLVKANETATKGSDAIPDVVDIRARALEAKADVYSPGGWKKADHDFANLTEDFEEGKFYVKDSERQKLIDQYLDLHLTARQAQQNYSELSPPAITTDVVSMAADNSQLSNKIALDEKYKKTKSQFKSNEAEVLRDDDKIIIRLKALKFSRGDAELSPSSYSLLTKVESAIKSLGDAEIDVEGHTDSFGSKEMNYKISEERADAVKNYLLESGAVISKNITASGYADEKPIATNRNPEGRARNRRVDIIITPQ